MSGLGLRLFASELRKRPAGALIRLLLDYLTYVGMIGFLLFLVALRRPLAWLDGRLRRPLRPRLIDWFARRSHG
jgi:hypothetical protein